MADTPQTEDREVLDRERGELLQRIVDAFEKPMVVLGFVWLALLVIELIRGLDPVLEMVGTIIWVIFIIGFLLEFTVAPRKMEYLRRNWLTAVSLAVPALRVFRAARAIRAIRLSRATRQLRLVRVIGSLNRGMKALGATLRRRGFGYVVALTLVVTFAGAAGMYAFEKDVPDNRGLKSYPTALWWTAMIITTLGSEYWPQTAEGRVLCVVLALYSLAVLGYITATLATFLIGRDAESDEAELAGEKSVAALRADIARLHEELHSLRSSQP